MLLKNPGRYDEGARGITVIVEAGGLPRHPADRPNVVVGTVIQPFIPAVFGAQPHPIQPSIGRHEPRDDVGKFLRRFQDCGRLVLRCYPWAAGVTYKLFLWCELHRSSPKLCHRRQAPGTDAGWLTDASD